MDDFDVRDRETRIADTLAMLTTQGVDVWVATASAEGEPWLVPVSLAWDDDRAISRWRVLAHHDQPGAGRRGSARRGPSRDVVMIDAVVEDVVVVAAAEGLG